MFVCLDSWGIKCWEKESSTAFSVEKLQKADENQNPSQLSDLEALTSILQ